MNDIHKLTIVYPDFNSNLTNVIIDLEKMRQKQRYIDSDVHPIIFFQLKDIFHLLESLGSVRIEGNNTTISEYIDHTISGKKDNSKEQLKEVDNIQNALQFIHENIKSDSKITKEFILKLHEITVFGLNPVKDGDSNPGEFRIRPVFISNSRHVPPKPTVVDYLMDELIGFINDIEDSKDQLLSVAISHHRFSWIHPFSNGNGRVVRLITYAMLIKQGFSVKEILNPTAIFCNDRDTYYKNLAIADQYDQKGQIIWCEYVLKNLLEEINKIDRLLDKGYLLNRIIYPALVEAVKYEYITEKEQLVLKIAAEKGEFKAADLRLIFPGRFPVERSRIISRLKQKKMITNAWRKDRIYIPRFIGSPLTRSLINAFHEEGFVPMSE